MLLAFLQSLQEILNTSLIHNVVVWKTGQASKIYNNPRKTSKFHEKYSITSEFYYAKV